MAFIKTLKKVNGLITLKQCKPPFPELLISNGESLNITFLDTETTGTNRLNDEIIEIAIKKIEFEKDSGKIIKITKLMIGLLLKERSYTTFIDRNSAAFINIMLMEVSQECRHTRGLICEAKALNEHQVIYAHSFCSGHLRASVKLHMSWTIMSKSLSKSCCQCFGKSCDHDAMMLILLYSGG